MIHLPNKIVSELVIEAGTLVIGASPLQLRISQESYKSLDKLRKSSKFQKLLIVN